MPLLSFVWFVVSFNWQKTELIPKFTKTMNKQTFNDFIIKDLNGFEVFKRSLFEKVLIETKYNFLKLKKVTFNEMAGV